MSAVSTTTAAALPQRRRRPATLLLLRGWSLWRVRIGVGLLAFIVALVIFGPLLAPHSPSEFVGTSFQSPSSRTLFGTDYLGRDVLSRLLWGGRTVLGLSLAAATLGVSVGAVVGLIAAYSRGLTDDILMRGMDFLLAFPAIIFALLAVATVGPKLWLVVLAVGVSHIPRVARVTRGAALDVVGRDFVYAVRAMAEPKRKILLGEILPNITGPLFVEASLRITFSIGLIAGLSFLGFGLQPPAADWGLMINENRAGIATQPWAVIAPIVAIAILTIATSLIADGFARALAGLERVIRR
jgi:peptide/nickel transport system permease protein